MNGFRKSLLLAGVGWFLSLVIGGVLIGNLDGGAEALVVFWLLGWLYAVAAAGWFIFRCLSRPVSLSRAGHSRIMLIDGCFYLAYVAFLGTLMLPPPFAVREAARNKECCLRLKRIGLAMASYSAKFGSYPPAYAVDRKGRPTVSWRVLLLPYFDDPQASKVYENIRLDEPWDSPHNREATAISEIDRFFQCPTAITPAGETNYAMVVGPDTISDGPHSTRPGNIKDISHTIVVVEVFGAGIHWAKPRDVDFKTMLANGVSGAHKGFAHVLFADGHVQPPATGIDPKTLNAVLTRNGGEEAKEIDKY